MSTDTLQHEEKTGTREPLPPMELDAAAQVHEQPVKQELVQGHNPLPAKQPETALAPPAEPKTAMGRFLYNHRGVTKNPVGHLGYQMIRNMAAAVPYGIATVAVSDAFGKVTKATAGAAPGTAKNLTHQISKSPIMDIAMIAAGFTLYRGTLKYVRYFKEYLFNPDYTPEQADEAAKNAGHKAVELVKEIAPAEVNSTPIAAIALGLGRRYRVSTTNYSDIERAMGAGIPGSNYSESQKRMLHFMKDGKLNIRLEASEAAKAAGIGPFKEFCGKFANHWHNSAINVLAFLSFFELGDRLYKDVQLRRGIWNGEHNSLGRVSPEKEKEIAAQEQATGDDKDVDHYKAKHGIGEHKETLGKSDPNLLRWCFTRALPTIVGITAYTGTKRVAYLTMGHFKAKDTFLKRAVVEGLATSTFFVMTTSNDVFEGLWKSLFAPKEQGQQLSEHQSAKHEELLGRINAKEQSAGRAA